GLYKTELEFRQNGSKTGLDNAEKKEMEEKLMFAVLGLVRDFREFNAEEIQAWVSLKWLTKEQIEVEKLSRNTFIFYCRTLSTLSYKGALVIFKRWIPNSSLRDYDLSWVTLWVRIEGLPLHINQVHIASNLLERFGPVIYFDGKVKVDGPQKIVRARHDSCSREHSYLDVTLRSNKENKMG
ncbi:UDP-N-acetylglucosamine 1-carboxyvinyltransferase 2, partial [Bienertia sinuspersici]